MPSDETPLRRAVCAAPDDDTVRLAYADFLDERAAGDDAARAAYVRAAVARFRCGPPHKSLDSDIPIILRRRGPGYYVTYCDEVASGLAVGDAVDVDVYVRGKIKKMYGAEVVRFLGQRRREQSFDQEVVLKWQAPGRRWPGAALEAEMHAHFDAHGPAWNASPCPACSGTGWAPENSVAPYCEVCGGTGDLFTRRGWNVNGTYQDTPRRVAYARGFVAAVECPFAEVGAYAFSAGGAAPQKVAFLPSAWANAVVREHPIERITVPDLDPLELYGGWNWMPGRPEPQSRYQVGPLVHAALTLPAVVIDGEEMPARAATELAHARADLEGAVAAVVRAWGGAGPGTWNAPVRCDRERAGPAAARRCHGCGAPVPDAPRRAFWRYHRWTCRCPESYTCLTCVNNGADHQACPSCGNDEQYT